MDTNQVLDEFNSLPPEAQRQVLDFIAFLQSRNNASKTAKKKTRQMINLDKSGFIGMWRDRDDIQDTRVWLRLLRLNEWRTRQ